ncbi:MAG: AAA family ATPase [Cyanothece sp. SIO2G6]|nr:AAA family ATPase [Cyanothece sp. SIO2G6]
MTADEPLIILENCGLDRLSTVQVAVIQGTWVGLTYDRMAQQTGYDPDYLKYVGSKLWQELSKQLGQSVSKSNLRAVLQQLQRRSLFSAKFSDGLTDEIVCDWGNAPVLAQVYGRQQEMAQLRQWCVEDRCRLVMLQGQGGIGKTTLARFLTQQMAGHAAGLRNDRFERVVWRSLRSAPNPSELLKTLVIALTPTERAIATDLSDWRSLLLHQLKQQRCFVVLDNTESLLESQSLTGDYLPGYEAYRELFEQVGEESHQSCVVLTGRELPAHFAALQTRQPRVRIYPVGALQPEACRAMVRDTGVVCGDEQGDALGDRYGGNPLALKLVATTIRDLFDGQVAPFLVAGTPLLGGVRQILDQQFARLLPLERQVMSWLAVHREPLAILDLQRSFLHPPELALLVEALDSLWRRCLIEKVGPGKARTSRVSPGKVGPGKVGPGKGGSGKVGPGKGGPGKGGPGKVGSVPNESPRFTQQPVIMEYVTRRLIDEAVDNLIYLEPLESPSQGAKFGMGAFPQSMALHRYSLLTPAAPDHICKTQKRLILQPVLAQLLQHWGSRQAIDQGLRQWVRCCQVSWGNAPSYGAGNGLNLLLALNGTVDNLEGAEVALWRIDGRGHSLRRSNFTRAHFKEALFTETFGSVLGVAIDPTGEWLASGDTNGEIRIWQISTGQLHQTVAGHASWVRSLTFHPTAPYLISASNDHTLKVWDWATGQCLHTLTGHRHWVRHLAMAPVAISGSPILASADAAGVIYWWNRETWDAIGHFAAHEQAVRAIAFLPNGCLLSGSEDSTIKLWNLETGQCLRTFTGHTAAVYSLQVTESGETVISGSADGEIRLWNTATGQCQDRLTGHQDAVWSLSLSADGEILASASGDSTIRLWHWQTGDCVWMLPGHQHWVLSVAFVPQPQGGFSGATLVSGSSDQTVRLWDVSTGNPLRILQGYTNGIFALTVDQQCGLLVSGSQDGQVNWWDTQWDAPTQQCLASTQAHDAQIWCVALSPDGRWWASAGMEPMIHLWRRDTGERHTQLDTGNYWVRSLTFSPDSRWLVSAGTTNDLLLWDLKTLSRRQISRENVTQTLTGHTDLTWAAIFSPDGYWLASCSNDATVRLWDWQAGVCHHILQGHRGPVESIVLSPSGDWLASAGGDGVIRLWTVPSGGAMAQRHSESSIAQLHGHTDQIGRLAVSADGRWLASSSNDQTVRIWDVQTGQCIQVLEQPGRLMYAIAFLPNPHTHLLATGDRDGQIGIWDCATGKCLTTWMLPRPYEGLDITNATGLTPAQQASLRQLGAIGDLPSP